MKKAYFKYIASLLLFGSNGIVAGHIAMSSYDIVFLRTMIGSALLLLIFLMGKNRFHIRGNERDTAYIVLSGAATGASWLFLYEAYQQIGVSMASLLYYCGPVIVMILSPFIFKEKLTVPKVAGFAAVLAGIVFVNGKEAFEGGSLWGLACGGMSAVMYALMIILNKQSRKITGTENAVIQLVSSFLTVAVFVGIKQHFVISVPSEAWPWILFLGLVNTGIGCYLYFSPLSFLPVQTVAVCGYIEPLSAVILASFMLNERMTAVQITGAVFIIGGAAAGELIKPEHLRVQRRRTV